MTDTDLLKNKHYIALNFKKAGISFSSENGDDPHDFLSACEDNISASNASDDAALRQIALCMKGSAYRWWRRNLNTIDSWSQFRRFFLEQFLPLDYDLQLEDTLRERIQYDDESFIEYVDAIETLYSKMEKQPTESEKVRLIIQNIQPFFKSYFRGSPCSTMQELFKKAREAEDEISEIHRYRMLQQRQGQCTYDEYSIIPPLSRGTLYRTDWNATQVTCMATTSTSDCQETTSCTEEPVQTPVKVPHETEEVMPVLPVSEIVQLAIGELIQPQQEVPSESVPIPPASEEDRNEVGETTVNMRPILNEGDEIPAECKKSAQELHAHDRHSLRFVITVVLFLNNIRCCIQTTLRNSFRQQAPVPKEKFRTIRKPQESILNPHVPSQVLTWSLLPPDLQLFFTRKFQKMTTPAMKTRCTVDYFLNYSTVYII